MSRRVVSEPRALPNACKVCKGTLEVPKGGYLAGGQPCGFCVNGVPRFTCPTCHETLPLCACFGELRSSSAA